MLTPSYNVVICFLLSEHTLVSYQCNQRGRLFCHFASSFLLIASNITQPHLSTFNDNKWYGQWMALTPRVTPRTTAVDFIFDTRLLWFCIFGCITKMLVFFVSTASSICDWNKSTTPLFILFYTTSNEKTVIFIFLLVCSLTLFLCVTFLCVCGWRERCIPSSIEARESERDCDDVETSPHHAGNSITTRLSCPHIAFHIAHQM